MFQVGFRRRSLVELLPTQATENRNFFTVTGFIVGSSRSDLLPIDFTTQLLEHMHVVVQDTLETM